MPKSLKKALKLSTEIDIHAVSCPGVWLPGRGRLSLSLCLLGFHTRTGRLSPVFPVMFHEKFKFDRTFVGVSNLSVLERVLESETVYIELMQEEVTGETVLAVFESSVSDLLFPRPAERLSYSGNDLDLLMEPTRDFPGIISPKIEVSTKTVVGETRSPLHQCTQDNVSFGHSQNKTTKATFKPIQHMEALKGNENNIDTDDRSKVVAFESRLERPEKENDLINGEGSKPSFAYKRAERNLLSRLPDSPKRNNRYLGIKSKYLSRSTGNISDISRNSLPSKYGATSSKPARRRRRFTDDDAHNARITLVQPERCPHCFGEHGSESCTTCRTYHRYFPRSAHPRPHYHHAHAYHAHPGSCGAALKILKQPPYEKGRARKRYLVDIDSRYDNFGEDKTPSFDRPSSAPLTKTGNVSGISADEYDEDDDEGGNEDEEKYGEEENRRKPKNKIPAKKLTKTRTLSRSPSPPSYASAPAGLTRNRYLDSDDDYLDDCRFLKRYRYPYNKYHPPYSSYNYDCPLCERGYSRYWNRLLMDPEWYMYPRRRNYPLEPFHSKSSCPICYKYNIYKPYFSHRYFNKWDPFTCCNRPFPYLGSWTGGNCAPFSHTFDETWKEGRQTKPRRRRDSESTDEILSDVYNEEGEGKEVKGRDKTLRREKKSPERH